MGSIRRPLAPICPAEITERVVRTRVAIVVPTYNGAAVVGAALRSLAEQRDAPWDQVRRVVVSDDASTDGTADTAGRAWPADHPTELVVRRLPANGGMWRNKNGAIESVAGVADWALILHQDDLAEPDWVRETVRQLDDAGDAVVSVSSDWLTEHADGRLEGRSNHTGRARPFVGRDAIRFTLKGGCWWHISGAAVRVDDFLRSGGFSTRYAYFGDLEYVLRSLERGRQIDFLDLPLIRFRRSVRAESNRCLSQSLDVTEWCDLFPIYARYLTGREAARQYWERTNWLARRVARGLVSRRNQVSRDALRAARRMAGMAFSQWQAAGKVPVAGGPSDP